MCTLDCKSKTNCSCLEKASTLCADHSKHFSKMKLDSKHKRGTGIDSNIGTISEVNFHTNCALYKDLISNNVKTICVSFEMEPNCEWDGVCTLKYNSFDNDVLTAADAKGKIYSIDLDEVIFYNSITQD